MAFCNQCESALPEGARFCASCGSAVHPAGSDRPETVVDRPAANASYSRRRRAVDAASDAATLASDRTRDTGFVTSAAVLDSAFFNDPRGAAVRYAGPVRVSGTIASMVMPGRTPALSMEGRNRFNYTVVNFPAGYRERLAPLSKGQVISVACDSVQELAGTTILSGCLLV